jgi:hypothetical protein
VFDGTFDATFIMKEGRMKNGRKRKVWRMKQCKPLPGSTFGPANAGRRFTAEELEAWTREHGMEGTG